MNRAIRDTKTVLEWVAKGQPGSVTTRSAMEMSAELLLRQAPFTPPRKAPKKAMPEPTRKLAREVKRTLRAQRVRVIREAVFKRANGKCENPGCYQVAEELDHYSGGARRRSDESTTTCWALCFGDHYQKTNNSPSRLHWHRQFAAHCATHRLAVPWHVAAELDDAEARAVAEGRP